MLIMIFCCLKPQNDYESKVVWIVKGKPLKILMQVYTIDFKLPKKYQKRNKIQVVQYKLY